MAKLHLSSNSKAFCWAFFLLSQFWKPGGGEKSGCVASVSHGDCEVSGGMRGRRGIWGAALILLCEYPPGEPTHKQTRLCQR